MLFSLQGYIFIGSRLETGKPGPMFWVGNVPEATLSLAQESETKNESFSGNRLPYGELNTGRSGTFNFTMDEWSPRNAALGLYSTPLEVEGSSATGEAFPEGLVAGDHVRLEHPYASALTITDSAVDPVPLVAGTNYRTVGHNESIIEILDVDGFTQPFSAAYTYATYTNLEVFTQKAVERYVVFDGIDTVSGNPVLVDLYRVNINPVENLGLIHAGYGSLPMTASVLYDPLNLDQSAAGGFFKIRQKAAA